ncbi:hypothetical protein HK103_002486 [Boothiomyces macroporosus]|uniref:Pentatricopeptide repeat-containing protein n=1 Tax=Boothiomyces macroporosus TaxID=261099 RepID=A0AAD5Y6R0_9FUNG|nr:hypothetical protein HK103_002486 [Boothiomyces macroporosus]
MDMKIFKEIISLIIKPQRQSLLKQLLEIRPGNSQLSIIWGIISSRWILFDTPPKYYPLLQIFKGHFNLVKPEDWIRYLDHQNASDCARIIHQLKQADVLTLDICIKALEVACTKGDRKSQNSIHAMISTFRMNEYSANKVVLALCNAGQVDKCMRMVEKYGSRLKQATLAQVIGMLLKQKMELLAQQLIPLLNANDRKVENVILNIYSKTNYQKMMQQFDRMEKDAISLGTVLNANGNDVNLERALKIYKANSHLKSEGVLNILCHNLASRGYLSQVREIVEEFVQAGIKPTEHTIAQLLLGFHQCKLNEMEYIQTIIDRFKIKKGHIYYTTLLQIYSDGNPLLLDVIDQLQQNGLVPQYNSLINILKGATALEKWDIVQDTVKKLYKKKINQEHLILVFIAAKKSNNSEMLQQIMAFIKKAKLRMDIQMYEYLLDFYSNQPEIIPDILTTIIAEFKPTDHIFNYLLDYDFHYDYKMVRLKKPTFQKLLRKLGSNQLQVFKDYKDQYEPTVDDYLVVMKAVNGEDLVEIVEMFMESDLEPTVEIKEQIARLKEIEELERVIDLYNQIN